MLKSQIVKWLFISIGAVCIVVGALTLLLPIPTGLPLMMVGIPLVMRFSPTGRRWILKVGSVWPPLRAALLKLHRKHRLKRFREQGERPASVSKY